MSGGKRGEERNKEERLERACDLTNSIIKFARLLPVHGATLQRLLHWPSRFIRGGGGFKEEERTSDLPETQKKIKVHLIRERIK